MKIQLKHLASYLPYNLRVVDGGCTFTMTGSFIDQWFNYGELGDVKPILRPMSDLLKHEYKSFADEWDLELHDSNGFVTNLDKDGPTISWQLLGNYGMFEALFSNHFDLFGLIEKGLAIDVNTIDL